MYYLYLLVKLFFRILENVVIIRIVNRSYPYLSEGASKPLSAEIRADIKKKVTEEYLRAFPNLEGKYSVHICDSADGLL